jgi:hypothetical protein
MTMRFSPTRASSAGSANGSAGSLCWSRLAGIATGLHKVAEVIFGCIVGLLVSWLMSKIWLVQTPAERE